jgi:hypothetical protein
MAKNYCAILILVLILASIIMQFVRARKRQGLVRQVVGSRMPEEARQRLSRVDRSFDPLFKDYRKLRVIRNHTNLLTKSCRKEYETYRNYSRVEILVTVSMLLFCVFAFKVCN